MSDSKQRKIGVILSYFSITLNIIIQLIYTPFLIKNLGQSEYGLYSIVSSIIGYLTILDLGFGNAIIVYTSKFKTQNKIDDIKKLNGMFFIIFLIIGFVASVLGIIMYFNIPLLFGNSMSSTEIEKAKIMMLILSFNLFITFAFSIYSSIISANEKFVFQKIMVIISIILKPLIIIPLLFLGFKSISMTIVITFVNFIVVVSNYIFCKRKLNVKIKFYGFDKKIFKPIFAYSFFIFLGVIVDKINWSVDQVILGTTTGTIAVSVYSVGSQINQLFINFSTTISSVLLPKMSKMIAKNSPIEEVSKEFIKVGRIQYLIIFFMASCLILFGKQFIRIWVGNKFNESYFVALFLVLPLCIPLIQNLGLSIIQAMNKYKFRTVSMAIMSLFNIVISIFLAKLYGPIGSAMGTALSLIIVNVIIMNIYYYKKIKLDIPKFWKEILRMTLFDIIPFTFMIIILRIFNINGYIYLIIFSIIYLIIYSINSFFLVMNNYEKELFKKMFYKILFFIKRGVKNENK